MPRPCAAVRDVGGYNAEKKEKRRPSTVLSITPPFGRGRNCAARDPENETVWRLRPAPAQAVLPLHHWLSRVADVDQTPLAPNMLVIGVSVRSSSQESRTRLRYEAPSHGRPSGSRHFHSNANVAFIALRAARRFRTVTTIV